MYRRKPEPNAVLPPNAGFSRRLEYLMIRYGHTAVSLAKKTGLKDSTIRSYCYGCREPEGLTRLITLADAFGVPKCEIKEASNDVADTKGRAVAGEFLPYRHEGVQRQRQDGGRADRPLQREHRGRACDGVRA